MDRIEEARKKEEEKLNALKTKKSKIEEKIKSAQNLIEKYTQMITQKKFSEMDDVLKVSGIALEDIVKALKEGDLKTLQEKIEAEKKAAKSSNDDEKGE